MIILKHGVYIIYAVLFQLKFFVAACLPNQIPFFRKVYWRVIFLIHESLTPVLNLKIHFIG